MAKTKEMIFVFWRSKTPVIESVVRGESVEIVHSYKYMATVFDDQLKWDLNSEEIIKRGQQRMFLLRKIRVLWSKLRYSQSFLSVIY